MSNALVIGGTRFIGRHLVTELLDGGYELTLFNRGNHGNPFAEDPRVSQYTGDRKSDAALQNAKEAVEPDVVVDCVAYYPGEVEVATRVFDGVDAYVFVSSGAAYERGHLPKREDGTPLRPCSDDEAVDDSAETYGARKAAGDRAVFDAAERGVRAMSVRPTIVYGPHDYTGRLRYWIDRIRNHDRVLVPGDGTNIQHLVSVSNTVRAIRTVAENGTPGEAYNVGDRQVLPLGRLLRTIAMAVDSEVEFVTANDRELAEAELSMEEFPLYSPEAHLLSTSKLYGIGWDPLPVEATIQRTVTAPAAGSRDPGPERTATEQVLETL